MIFEVSRIHVHAHEYVNKLSEPLVQHQLLWHLYGVLHPPAGPCCHHQQPHVCQFCGIKAGGQENCSRLVRSALPETCTLVSAKVNVVISRTLTMHHLIFMIPLVLRILFGPLPNSLVVCYHYSNRIAITNTLSLVLIKTILMSAFIWNFSFMSGKNHIFPVQNN